MDKRKAQLVFADATDGTDNRDAYPVTDSELFDDAMRRWWDVFNWENRGGCVAEEFRVLWQQMAMAQYPEHLTLALESLKVKNIAHKGRTVTLAVGVTSSCPFDYPVLSCLCGYFSLYDSTG